MRTKQNQPRCGASSELHEASELLCEDSEDCIIGNNEESEENDDIDSEVDDGDDLKISDGGNASTTSDANVVTEYLTLEKGEECCVDSLWILCLFGKVYSKG